MAPSDPVAPSLVRERAVRIVLVHEGQSGAEWSAMRSIAEKIGYSRGALRSSVRQAEQGQERRPGGEGMAGRLKELERGIPEFR